MKKLKPIATVILVFAVFAATHFMRSMTERSRASSSVAEEGDAIQQFRIVSMAPSSCEALYALGLGGQVVGVSRFTRYPADAAKKSKVGGYMDVDLEALVRLEPNYVVLLKEQSDLAKQLEGMGMKTVLVDHMTVSGILESIQTLGNTFQKADKANAVTRELGRRVEAIRVKSQIHASKSVLFSIGREVGQGKVNSLVAAGSAGFHQELLGYANLNNAYTGSEKFPQLSRENIITMDPEVIIDMVNSNDAESIGVEKIRADWAAHTELQAVRNGRVYLLVGDKYFIPGPRFPDILGWLQTTVHGEGDE